ncbi:ribonuclease HI [Dysgonomonas sp. PH5-45]|uniref:ribonuclease H family protein n=1 Tax=unclassified Dysgonomonas TaxID=2630389 RepID=UPI0024754063|nr:MULTISPECIES: ribonuclease H family protein [unclassified Dysgonomonas]MDH6354777.1 ribonuclease HI [Dysgonomonas sp. PH5-45]MDH6387676.1 ribonuclease HI [Dysgonomonas sp. PH5-37]
MAKKNFYTVWNGVKPGVYDSWNECKAQVEGYDGAIYKSFPSRQLAEQAFKDNPWKHVGQQAKKTPTPFTATHNIIKDSLSVDAACSGNPGAMEYRGVYVRTGEQIFIQGPFEQGTNNVGEFLALVHGLALLKQQNLTIPIYTDSVNAIKWVKDKKCKTKLEQTEKNAPIFDLIERAEKWLRENTYTTQILKWETAHWGEIPADFGRK